MVLLYHAQHETDFNPSAEISCEVSISISIYTCKVKGNICGFDPHFRSENALGTVLVT